ncbi:unnamed protein product [Echinostoma caproni]|uniref:Uncharacterized protein n=1 Tax=Echinostoma caproni TaxID=27848 RepID=A0A183B3F0_9TREM|nr:unnamed protein product [Echinostoma caproni]
MSNPEVRSRVLGKYGRPLEQDSINPVPKVKGLIRNPVVYTTLRDGCADLSKASKYCHRIKSSSTGDTNGPCSNETIQLTVSPHSVRQAITTASKSLSMLRHMLRMNLTVHSDPKQSADLPRGLNEISKSLAGMPRGHQLRRIMNTIAEAAERINSRRHVDRVLIHLRRRSTAKSMMYLIDQERHKKSPWRL